MTRSGIYFTGLILAISGVIGIFSEIGPVMARYIVFGLGLVMLAFFFIKQKPNQ